MSVQTESKGFLATFKEALTSDTERVKAATATLKKDFYPLPMTLLYLLELLVSNESTNLRQLAATQAKNLVPKHWDSEDLEEHRADYRRRLIERTLVEQDKLVRHGASRVIAAIAKIDFENTEWQDLIDTLLQAGVSQSPRAREVSTFILYSILESAAETMLHQLRKILPLFAKTINDPESEVRANTMLALGQIAIVFDSDNDEDTLQAVQDSIPHIVGVLKAAIDTDDEDHALQAFEVFQTLLSCDPQVLNKYFRDLLQFMAQIAAETEIDEDYRTQAISFLMQAVLVRKSKVQALKLGEDMTLKCLEIATELNEDPDDDDDEMNPPRSALGLLTILAEKLPPSQVVAPLLHALGAYVNSDNPDRRRGGILALGMGVEGAPGFVATQLSEITTLIIHLLADSHPRVRRATLDCLIKMGEDLSDDLAKEHQKLIPAIARTMDRAVTSLTTPNDEVNIAIIKASCNALAAVAEGMEQKDMETILPELYPRVGRLLSHPDLKIKAAAIEAIGAIATSADDSFLPYFKQTMNALSDYVRIKDSEEELDLRCITCDTMGFLALAVGPESFQPYVRPMMEATGEAMHLDHPKLKETSFLFWGNMAKAYGLEFKPFLNGVVTSLFESLESEESELEVELGASAADLAGKEVVIGGKKVKVAAMSEEELNEASEIEDVDVAELDDDDDDDDWDDEFQAISAVAQEKEIALEVLGDVVEHLTMDFMPYLEKTVKTVIPLVEHHYEGLRRAAIGTLFRVYNSYWALQPDDLKNWNPGLPLQHRPSPEVTELGEMIMKAVLGNWPNDDDPDSVRETSRSLSVTLKVTGPSLIAFPSTLKTVTETILLILVRKHPCQLTIEDSDDEFEDAESAEYESAILDTALEALVGVAHVLGETFGELWKMFEKPVMAIATSSEHFERSTATGVIAAILRATGSALTPATGTLLKLFIHHLSDEDNETRSNAAFGVGVLTEQSSDTAQVIKSFPTILGRLEPMLQTGDARMVDNAAGCVSRMIHRHRDDVPIELVLPALVKLLPLKEDFEENEPVWAMVVQLYSTSEPTIISLTPQLLPILESVLGPPEEQLLDNTRDQLTQMVKFIHGKYPGEIKKFERLSEVAAS